VLLRGVALSLLLVMPVTARATSTQDVRVHLISINRLCEALEYERALSQIQLARQAPRGTEEEVTLSLCDPRIETREDMQRSVSRGSTWQTVGVSLIGVGVVGLTTAAGMYALGAPDSPVAMGVSTHGTSAFVHGRWP
jgi:hypothetical protein